MKPRKVSAVNQARALIAAMNGEPFTYHLLKDMLYGLRVLTQLCEDTGSGEIKIIGKKKIEGYRECNLYQATGKPAPISKRSATYRDKDEVDEEYPLLGGKSIKDYPKAAVTVHRIGR